MKPQLQYLDFDLALQTDGAGYRADVLNSPGGQGSHSFQLQLQTTVDQVLGDIWQQRDQNARLVAAKKFGGALFEAVFAGDIATCWRTSLALTGVQGRSLRLRLRLTRVPELANLPWEFLYDASLNRFFSLSFDTPLVRFLDVPNPPRALPLNPPLRILVMLSSPTDYEQLDVEREWNSLKHELDSLIQSGVIELERLDEANLSALQRRLRQGEYHILHYIGHGDLDAAGNSALVLEGENGQGRLVGGEMLSRFLLDHNPLRLVILNACLGARSIRNDPFGGVAQSIIQQGIPAVVAMQFKVSDDAALVMTREFYAALVDRYPLDGAVTEARKAIYALSEEVEWATPVLYLRAPDGIIFDLQAAAGRGPAARVVETVPPPARETLSFDELVQRAVRSKRDSERIFQDTPYESSAYQAEFQKAYEFLTRADALRPDDPRVLFRMAQVASYLDLDHSERAATLLRRVESLVQDSTDAEAQRLLADAYYLHALLKNPPNVRLLDRASDAYADLNDHDTFAQINALQRELERTNGRALGKLYEQALETARNEKNIAPRKPGPAEPQPSARLPGEFNPIGRWNFQVQDMIGSRLQVNLAANGTFEMTQQIGMYQVPASGTWTFNSMTQQLDLQGVVNTFQPLALHLRITGKVPSGFTATGSDGISYLLVRV